MFKTKNLKNELRYSIFLTSILANNGGNIKVEGTLTNIGSIVGSLSEENRLSVEANKVVVENLKDHNKGENAGIM